MLTRNTQWFAHEGVRYRVLRWHVGNGSVASDNDGSRVPCVQGGSQSSPERMDGLEVRAPLRTRPIFPPQTPLVFLHGFAQSAESWSDVVDCLEQTGVFSANVYALDFVGHGESDKPADALPYSMNATCDMLLAFLCEVRRANEGRAPVVVGYSMGGRIALAAVCRTAGIPLSALVLESAGLGLASLGERTSLARANAECAWFLRKHGVEQFMDKWESLPLFASQRDLTAALRARLRVSRLANDAEALARTLEGTGAQHMPSQEESLTALATLIARDIPVYYLAGARDEKYRALANFLRERMAALAHNRAPAAELPIANPASPLSSEGDAEPKSVSRETPTAANGPYSADRPFAPFASLIVEGAGHNTHLERPEQFARYLALCGSPQSRNL